MIILLSLFFSVLSHDYNMLPFIWKNFSIAKEGEEFNLFLKASHSLINITFSRKTYYDYIDNLYIYEYPSKEEQYSNLQKYNYSQGISLPGYEKDTYIKTYSYKIINDTTNFISIKFKPDSTINELHIKLALYGGYYNLLNGGSEKFVNIKRDYDYYYNIKTKHKLVNISLILNYMEINPINYFFIYEYKDNKNISLYIKKENIKFVSKKIKNQLIA